MSKSKSGHTVGFIGAGQMATALAKGLTSGGFSQPDLLAASDPSQPARAGFTEQVGAKAFESGSDVLQHAEIVILAVKPQHMREALDEIKQHVTPGHLIISIVAGFRLELITDILGPDTRVVRVMPNTPSLVGAGAAAYALGGSADRNDAELVQQILSCVGISFEVPESLLDAVTGLSGSGPAYVYLIIESLSDGGVRAGLPREIATRLAAQTVLGAARMVLETGLHPGVLKDAVTSPGGTTIAGLSELEAGGVRNSMIKAVQAATLRSRELGQSS